MVRDVVQAAGVAGGSGTGPGTEARDAKTTFLWRLVCQPCDNSKHLRRAEFIVEGILQSRRVFVALQARALYQHYLV